MVSGRGVSAVVCALVGLASALSVIRDRGSDAGAAVAVAAAPPAEPARDAPRPAAAVDRDLPTGAIAPGSALHAPDPAAYRGAAKMGDPVTVTGAEAINYLAGNTLRREAPGRPTRLTYFASRGLYGDGDEHAFVARRWDRDRPELCEAGPNGATLCRTVSILLDGKYEFPGAHLGTVTLGAAGDQGAATAALVKGDALRFPDHIPFLDSAVGAAPDGAGPAGGDPVRSLAGRTVAAAVDGAPGRQTVYYARDDRRLELRQVQSGDGRAVEVGVGRWREGKGTLCQTRGGGDPQTCFKVGAAGGGLRLVPAGRGGEAQTLTVLPETSASDVAGN